jgi:hypothetical protein
MEKKGKVGNPSTGQRDEASPGERASQFEVLDHSSRVSTAIGSSILLERSPSMFDPIQLRGSPTASSIPMRAIRQYHLRGRRSASRIDHLTGPTNEVWMPVIIIAGAPRLLTATSQLTVRTASNLRVA